MNGKRDALFNELRMLLGSDETDEAQSLELTIAALKSGRKLKPPRQPRLSALQFKTLQYLVEGHPVQKDGRSYVIAGPEGPWKFTQNTLQKLQAYDYVKGLQATPKGKTVASKPR